jgi:hypothetical protein
MYITVFTDKSLPSTIGGSWYPVFLLFVCRTVAMMVGGKMKIQKHEAGISFTCGGEMETQKHEADISFT